MPEDPADIPALARMGVERVMVPSSPMGGTGTWASTPDEVLALADLVESHAGT